MIDLVLKASYNLVYYPNLFMDGDFDYAKSPLSKSLFFPDLEESCTLLEGDCNLSYKQSMSSEIPRNPFPFAKEAFESEGRSVQLY
jgi:hypothetical protein